MTPRRVHDVTFGTLFSFAVHLFVLLTVGGWLGGAERLEADLPISVAIWSPPDPVRDVEPTPEEVPAARTVPEADPAPAEVLAHEPAEVRPEPLEVEEDPIETPALPVEEPVIPAPPAELARPELPEVASAATTEVPLPPFLGAMETPPAGPDVTDRLELLSARRDSTSTRGATRVARARRARPAAGFEVPSDTTITPVREAPVAAEQGVVGPLGQRHILYSEAPPYPAWARRQGLEAEVRFKIWVSPEGSVVRIEVLQRSGVSELDRLAEAALRNWKFAPLPPGVPERDEWGEVPMQFTLVTDNR